MKSSVCFQFSNRILSKSYKSNPKFKICSFKHLQNKFAQNWFFKNSDNEDTDNLVDEDNEGQVATNRVLSRDEQSDSNENNKTGKTILGKIKKIVDTNKTKHREMNFWQPQGS